MIDGDKFVISFPWILEDIVGTVTGLADKHTHNYYMSHDNLETMCCNCDK